MNHLENVKKMMTGEIADPPVAQVLGFKVVGAEEGRVVVELEASERLHNPMGTLHGGVLCDIADAAMGLAFASTLAEDEIFTTIEIKLNFLKPVFKSKLRAEGKLIKKGATVGLLECHVYDEKDSLVAHSTSTCMILKGNSQQNRVERGNDK
ncbi:uncharacterized protein (TIGR00369 family) [Virgibacillus halotolerans]|uniref:PaaI family thioesterase n=1 Tax=Virgibacillus halotolerans TaxID=1071053 RepID=UPI0019618991|nr:PaaI family thioesterase [Virgibacillus halotolerans]MBM7601509.1 uncharacterized protein (TIGR00369 family) [Virgibacillus halotolerans]